jgi:hypothetical protein
MLPHMAAGLYLSRRGIELGHRLLLLKRTQGEKVVVGKLHSFYLQKKGRPNWDKSQKGAPELGQIT